jgi:hypothetical protein
LTGERGPRLADIAAAPAEMKRGYPVTRGDEPTIGNSA